MHLLDNLSTRANNGTDKLFGYFDLHNAWNLRFKFGTWLCNRFGKLAKDVLAACLSLHQGLFKNFKTQAIALNVHLRGRKSVFCTRCLEVHVAQVILVAKDVAEDGVLFFARIFDKTHSNTANGLFKRHTCIHQSKRSGTYGGHRRRTVALQNLTYHTYGVGIVFGYLTLQTTPSQVAVANFATANATLSLGLAC